MAARSLLAVALFVVGAACSSADEPVQVLTDEDTGAEIDLSEGERFEVRLESNATTGYAWELSAMTTAGLVSLDSETYVAPDSDLVGAPGTQVFVFVAGAEADGVLRLEYVRSFDDPVIPERVVEYLVRID